MYSSELPFLEDKLVDKYAQFMVHLKEESRQKLFITVALCYPLLAIILLFIYSFFSGFFLRSVTLQLVC